MNIQIRFVDINKNENLEKYAEKKIAEVLKKFSRHFSREESILAEIELSKVSGHHEQGDLYKASLNVEGFEEMIHAEAITDDFYKSIDSLRNRLQEILANQKNKRHTLSRRFGSQFKKLFRRH